MPEIVISGIPVHFPYEPYDVQIRYMEKVIKCLESSTNGMLESPTGTGKTLSLLCSTLAWITLQKSRLNKSSHAEPEKGKLSTKFTIENSRCIPKVIYSSRTHSQLIQAMNELKNSAYSCMKAVVLGSRDQLCIHPEVSQKFPNSMKIHMCKIHITTHSCTFYNNVEKRKDDQSISSQNVIDIEDLITIGRKLRVCPYFISKEIINLADVIFMPYNYILDPKARKAHNINLENTIVIFDEAHNIEKICEESASVQIKSSDIALCIQDVTQLMETLNENGGFNYHDDECDDVKKNFTIDDLVLLKKIFLDFEIAIDEIEIKNKEGVAHTAKFMFDLLGKADIRLENQAMLCRVLDNLIQYISVASENNSNATFRRGAGLERFLDLLTVVFVSGNEEIRNNMLNSFKVYVEVEELKTNNAIKKGNWATITNNVGKVGKIINYWCFNPGFGMEQLLHKNVRSVILTSGTLTPLKPLITELGIPISEVLENPHIVEKSQVCVKIISFGPDREPLNSSFKNRDSLTYITSLGRTILSVCPITPGGILIFFPSYPFMNKCIDSWKMSGICTQINRYKPVFVEPQDKETFMKSMSEFNAKIRDPVIKGACFMAVCRGKVSEGLDFANDNGRAVIITGLPYPPLKDPKVILKRQYLESNRNSKNQLLSGDHWYGLEATRAVNQAIGRVIRHKNDYGAILLCDSRFNICNQKSQLSSWIQGHLGESNQHTSFGPFIADIAKFFKNAKKNCKQTINRTQTTSFIHLENNFNSDEVLQKRQNSSPTSPKKKKKLKIVSESLSIPITSGTSSLPQQSIEKSKLVVNCVSRRDDASIPLDRTELLKLIKQSLSEDLYGTFINCVTKYHKNEKFDEFFEALKLIFSHPSLYYLFKSMRRFVKEDHKKYFDVNMGNYCTS